MVLTCEFEGCSRKVSAKGLCRAHYMQQWQGRELTPLRPYVVTEQSPEGRVCTGCMKFKKWDQFYVRTNGIPQSRCKRCFAVAQTNRRNQEAA